MHKPQRADDQANPQAHRHIRRDAFVIYCLGCGYILDESSVSRKCPECGRDYDPEDALSVDTRPPLVLRRPRPGLERTLKIISYVIGYGVIAFFVLAFIATMSALAAILMGYQL